MATKREEEADPIGVQPVTVDLLAQVLERMPKGLDAASLMQILEAHSAASQKQIESTRIVRHSNADHAHISAFSYPEGDLARPKPRHRAPDGRAREVYFNGGREHEEQLTPEEIDAYNMITESKEARDGRWKAEIRQNGKRLLVTVPSYTLDDRMELPPLVLILRELALGATATDPSQMATRLAALERAMADRGIVVPV
jgi:hypothetical protein